MAGRAIGWLLLAYAVAGFMLLAVGLVGGLEVAGRVERLMTSADRTLAAASRATDAAAESFVGIDDSLADAQQSTDGAAALAADASGTLRSLSVAMQVSIFGTRPLQPLAADFAASADQASQLADTLGGMTGSLADTRTDVASIGAELEQLSLELDALREETAVSDAPPVRLFVLLLLGWLALPALAALVAGIILVRPARTV